MSDPEFKPIHTIHTSYYKSSIKYAKDTNTDIIYIHVYNNSLYKITLLLGSCETNATFHPPEKRAIKVDNNLKLLDTCQSTIFYEELSKLTLNRVQNETRNNSQKQFI